METCNDAGFWILDFAAKFKEKENQLFDLSVHHILVFNCKD